MENKDFVEYQEALGLKELGFDEPCLFYYYGSNDLQSLIQIDMPRLVNHNESTFGTCYSAPSYSQAFRWLYQELGIEKGVMPLDTESQRLLLKELIDMVKNGK